MLSSVVIDNLTVKIIIYCFLGIRDPDEDIHLFNNYF